MKKNRKIWSVVAVAAVLGGALTLSACPGPHGPPSNGLGFASEGNFQYDAIEEQGFYDVSSDPSSYFSLDKNTASYSQVRAQLKEGYRIAPDSVRLEELVNYFDYGYASPEEGEEMRVSAYLSDCPWNRNDKLVTIGLKTETRVLTASRNNYVLLIDVSGSMSDAVKGMGGVTRLELVKYGISLLLDGLTEQDAVSIVTYANGVETKCEPTWATPEGKRELASIVQSLKAYGPTNGAGGLERAYACAEQYKQENGNNRVILMTDGDFNVGMRNTDELNKFVRTKAESGVYLSVLGVGMGNMRDDVMQTLALNGNGNYAYLDGYSEAERVFCEQLNGMLVTVAKDAKAGVTFFGDQVKRYRLLGYDMKRMSESDFNDPDGDAGEIGNNLCVTAVYEVELSPTATEHAPLAEVTVRYKSVKDGEEQREIIETVENAVSESEDAAFIACVAEFALVLRQSQYKHDASIDSVQERLETLKSYLTTDSYKEEFAELVDLASLYDYDVSRYDAE